MGHFTEPSRTPIIAMLCYSILCQCAQSGAGCAYQVLKEKFPGVLLAPDICALQGLPAVRLMRCCGNR